MGIIAAIRHRIDPGTTTTSQPGGTESESIEPMTVRPSRLRWVHVERDGQPVDGYPYRPDMARDES